jgi:hypothetical protein
MQIFQLYVTVTAFTAVGLTILILTSVVTKARKSVPASNQSAEDEQLEWAWWVEVITAQPNCTYYFGPFSSKKSAEIPRTGYVEDLEKEGASEITTQIKWYKPRELTIYEDKLAEAGGYSGW